MIDAAPKKLTEDCERARVVAWPDPERASKAKENLEECKTSKRACTATLALLFD